MGLPGELKSPTASVRLVRRGVAHNDCIGELDIERTTSTARTDDAIRNHRKRTPEATLMRLLSHMSTVSRFPVIIISLLGNHSFYFHTPHNNIHTPLSLPTWSRMVVFLWLIFCTSIVSFLAARTFSHRWSSVTECHPHVFIWCLFCYNNDLMMKVSKVQHSVAVWCQNLKLMQLASFLI